MPNPRLREGDKIIFSLDDTATCFRQRKSEPDEAIWFQAVRGEQEVRTIDGPEMGISTGVKKIALRLFVVPDAGFSFWMVSVIVILVNCLHYCGGVHDRRAEARCAPNEPVVPENPANHEGRNLAEVETARENEIIDPVGGPLVVGSRSQLADICVPRRFDEIDGSVELHVPAAADHQETLPECAQVCDGGYKVPSKNNVAVHVAEDFMTGNFLGAIE